MLWGPEIGADPLGKTEAGAPGSPWVRRQRCGRALGPCAALGTQAPRTVCLGFVTRVLVAGSVPLSALGFSPHLWSRKGTEGS